MTEAIRESINNIDSILVEMSADHPGDIIADILHWCDHYGEDFVNLVERAQIYHEDERNDQAEKNTEDRRGVGTADENSIFREGEDLQEVLQARSEKK